MSLDFDTEWHTTDDGYTRNLSKVEACVLSPAGLETWPAMFSIEIDLGGFDYSTFVDRLKKSWGRLAIDYPHFTSTVPAGSGKFVTRRIKNQSQLDDWVDQSFKIDDNYSSITDLLYNQKPVTHATLYYISKCGALGFACPHVNCDFRGSLYMFDRMLKEVVSGDDLIITFDNTPTLMPSIDWELAGAGGVTDEQKQLAYDHLGKFGQNVSKSLSDEPDQPHDSNSIEPGRAGFLKIPFTEEESKTIVDTSRQLGVTVTAMAYAALFESIRHLDINKKAENYSGFLIMGMRDTIQDPAAKQSPIGVYSGVWPMSVETGGTLMDNVYNVTKQLKEQKVNIKDNGHPTVNKSSCATVEIASAFGKMIQDSSQASDSLVPTISSAGKAGSFLKHKYGPIVVNELWEFFEAQTSVMPWLMWGFKDRIYMSLSYNEASYSQGYVDKVVSGVKQHMLNFAQ